MKKYIATIICGFGAGVLQIVPFIKSFSCCLIIPAAAFLALLLDQKATKSNTAVPIKKAFLFGLLTGVFAALFGSFFELTITFITRQNDVITAFPEMQRMIENFPVSPEIKKEVLSLFQGVRNELMTNGFSLLYTFSVLLNNFVMNVVFGIIGALIGTQIINKRLNNTNNYN